MSLRSEKTVRAPCQRGIGAHLLLLGLVLIGLAPHADAAAETRIVTLLSAETAPYNRFNQQIKHRLDAQNPGHFTVSTQVLGKLDRPSEAFQAADLCVSVGIDAAQYLSQSKPGCRQIHAFVPRLLYERKRQNNEIACPEGRVCTALVIDQPIERQVALVKLALPRSQGLAVVLSGYSEALLPALRSATAKRGMKLNVTMLEDSDDIVPAVNDIIPGSNALLAIPDPIVFNAYTARAILLSTYRAGIPVIAYSASYVKAGALLGLYSTPEQIADHAAELMKDGKALPRGTLIYPKYFTLKKNASVQESLNIDLPTLYVLKRQLRGDHRE